MRYLIVGLGVLALVSALLIMSFAEDGLLGAANNSRREDSRREVSEPSTPEPSTLVLLGMGALALLAYAYRKRRRR